MANMNIPTMLYIASKAYAEEGKYFRWEDGESWLICTNGEEGWVMEPWSPHRDPGDALRLAIKLRLNLSFELHDGVEYACSSTPQNRRGGYSVPMGDNETTDTCMSVLTAAVNAMARK